jgi:chorismate-pyruvate lyase
LPLPPVVEVRPDAIPEPYRSLLVGHHDMTPTLEAFHGERLDLRVLERQQGGDAYRRLVLLTTEGGRPVEFGAILIDLGCLTPDAREMVLKGERPLGTVLALCGIEHASRPLAFIRVTAGPFINGALGLTIPHDLYGRRNVLSTSDGRTLADIVEILPP